MKVHLTADGYLDRINKALDPATAQGEYIGVTLIEPAGAERAGRRARGDVAARPGALLRGRLPGVRRPRRPRRHRARSAPSSGSRSTTTPTWREPGRSRAAADPHGRHAAHDRHRPGSGGRARPAAGRPPDLQRRPRRGRRRPGARRGDRRDAAPAARATRTSGDVEGGSVRRRRRPGRAPARRVLRRASSASAAAARSTSPSTPPASPACRWSRSPPASRTTASPRRSPRSRRRRRPQVLLRRADADRRRRRPRLRAPERAGDAALGHRRHGQQPVGDRRLAARRAPSAARRSTAWR